MLKERPPTRGQASLAGLAACLGSVQLMLLMASFCCRLGQQAGKRGVIQLGVGLMPGSQFLFQRVLLLGELLEALGLVLRLLGEPCLLLFGGMTALHGLVALLAGVLLASIQPLLPGIHRDVFTQSCRELFVELVVLLL